jgi:drug/metabolite transporter (DMT)-like permease
VTRPDQRLGAALAITSAVAINAVQDTLIKWISGDYPFHQMQTIRCAVALPLVLVLFVTREPPKALLPPCWPLLLLRGMVFATASVLFYLTLAAVPLPEAVALYFSMPLFVAVLAGPFLGERVRLARAVAVLVGFAGIVLMVRPGTAVFEPASLIGLGAAMLYAIGNMMTRPLGASISAATLAVYQTLSFLAIAGVLSLVFGWGGLQLEGHRSLEYLTRGWAPMPAADILFIVAIGIMTSSLMVLYTLAYRLADSSFVAPLEYTAMVWSVGLSWLVLRELPDAVAFAGIALVVAAGLAMLLLDRGRRPGATLANPGTA